MSRLLIRAGLLAQGAAGDPPPPVGDDPPWLFDVTRTPPGYTLSDGNRTVVNNGITSYFAWVPTARALRPWDGPRYWELRIADSAAAQSDAFVGVATQATHDVHANNATPVSLGSMGWRGDGRLWWNPVTNQTIRRGDLPTYGAGDVLMLVFDPATAGLWVGRNGVWHDDPVTGAPTWTGTISDRSYPYLQGRQPGEGATLRSLPAQFTWPVPAGVQPLAFNDPDLLILQAQCFAEFGWDGTLSIAHAEVFVEMEIP
ncbi:MAG: hypothetical protein ACXIVG_08060 [Pararhodobacter sp.]